MKKTLFSFLISIFLTSTAFSQLSAGDIAIISFNFDNPDEFGFVALVDIPSGTEIKFTDNGWQAAGTFRANEGIHTWTAPAIISAGTVVKVTVAGPLFSASGDQILAYQGADSSPTFIYALNSEGTGVWQTDATSSNTSALPTGLTNGQTAIALNEVDNGYYSGTTSGTKDELLSAISNPVNWTTNNTRIDNSNWPSSFTISGNDIAIIGFNFDNPDEFGFVALVDIPSGTEIKFTDNGWQAAGTFRANEGIHTWTAPAIISAGTVVKVTVAGPLFSASGDQILAYQGADSSPTFIYALNSEGTGVWQTDATSSNTSALPTGLTNGQTAIALNEVDNGYYSGTTSGTKDELLSAISNPVNWTTNNTRIDNSNWPSSFTVSDGSDTPPTVSTTTPIDAATGIALNVDIIITFNEDVTATGAWFTISGATSGAHTAAVAGTSPTFSLNPDADFAEGEVVTVTVVAAQVADTDGTADNMPADHVFSFTTAAPSTGWIINEIHADPAGDITGDANGDGFRQGAGDEFVELVNTTGAAANISGWTLSDGYGIRHTFPTGTILPDQSAIVVFGGGVPTGVFGKALVQTASTGGLGLNNGGDTITLNNGTTDVATYAYNGEGANNQSITRDPDISGADPLVKHSTATGSGGALFSPGTMIDGTAFSGAYLAIFEIQGSSTVDPYPSPYYVPLPAPSTIVSTAENIVTAVAPEGFFIQTPTTRTDGNTNTSDGIYVHLGVAPSVSEGDVVIVTAEVWEFYEFTSLRGLSPVVTVMNYGTVPLPDPITLDSLNPSPIAPQNPLAFEKYEGMLVSITGGVVNGPNQFFGSDNIAEAYISANSIRSYRERGAEHPGLGGTIPVWDGNPEIFELDPDKLGLSNIAITGGSTFDAIGVIGYEYWGYELWPSSLTIYPATAPTPIPDKTSTEFTIGSLNLLRLFDDIANSGTTIATAIYERRLIKLSMYIRERLKSPDILAVQEVEDLLVLQDLASQITTDDGSIVYTAYLEEGNDVGNIDVGFLVKEDRVQVDAVTQLGKTETFIDPSDNSIDILHDRPPLLLEGKFKSNTMPSYPIAAMVVHNRSLNKIESIRVQTKRLTQAQYIAARVQQLQVADPDLHLVVIGDFNAFEFTDGYVDVIGQILGDIVPTDNLLSGPDLVTPNLTNQVLSVPAEDRYSYIYQGTAQVLDHALTSRGLSRAVTRLAFGRGNVDSPIIFSEDVNVLSRSSDHDGLVLYIDASTPTYKRISGLVLDKNGTGIEGAKIDFSNSGLTATSDESGYYQQSITKGWSGTSTISAEGWVFDPTNYDYSSISENMSNQNFIGTKVYEGVAISGYVRDSNNIGIEGVAINFSNGGATVMTNSTGHYATSVTVGWGGTSTPTKEGWSFDPVSYNYTHITENLDMQDYIGSDVTLSTESSNSIPQAFDIKQNYPNPFNPSTTINYSLPEPRLVTITIYDVSGKQIKSLVNQHLTAGYHSIKWNSTDQAGNNVSAGIYFYNIQAGDFKQTRKMLLFK